MLHFDYLIKIYLFFTKRRSGISPGFEVSSSGLQDDCSTTRGNMGNLGVVIIDVNIDVEFSTSLSMVLELFGNTQG